MPRLLVPLVALVVALAVLLGPVAQLGAAQTDDAGVDASAADDGRVLLLQARLEALPPVPAIVRLRRVSLAAGAALPESTPPGLAFGVVEAGTLSVTVGGPVVLPPTANERDPAGAPPIGREFRLEAGDQIAFPAGTPRRFRNAGSSSTAFLLGEIVAVEEAGTDPTAADDPDGVTTRVLGQGTADRLPTGLAAVTIERFDLTAGLGIPAYPGPVLVAVEEGGFASTLDEGDAQLSEAGGVGVRPAVAPGAAFAVRPGDALFFPRGMAAAPPLEGDGGLGLLRFGALPLPEAATSAELPEPSAAVPGDAVPGDAFAVGSTVAVTTAEVRLRAAPSTDAEVLAELAPGQILVVTGPPVEGNGLRWYPVRDAADPTLTGYAAADFLSPA